MPRQVTFTKAGPVSRITDSHHRAGWMTIGRQYRVWCSCGWKEEGEGHWSTVEAVHRAHKAAVA